MSNSYILAGRRTAVAVRRGRFAELGVAELGRGVIRDALSDAELHPNQVDEVIMGNALYGGGNPARLLSLAAGLPERVSALSVDTQCCAGLDAIAIAQARIDAGSANVIVAGGVESYSRAPIRQVRPQRSGEVPQTYDRPPFTPWPDCDPDMIESAAELAARLAIPRERQEAFAMASHRLALADETLSSELSVLNNLTSDEFTRALSPALCKRLKPLAGTDPDSVTAATTAVEADAAAVVVVVSRKMLEKHNVKSPLVNIQGSIARGGDPLCPGVAPIDAGLALLKELGLQAHQISFAEVMEAFSVQAIACLEGLGLRPSQVNQRGGALARGHPIGASGAILAVRLFHDLRRAGQGQLGLAAIAAAGGLASAMILETHS